MIEISDEARKVGHTWIDGVLFVKGTTVDDWNRAKVIRRLLQRENIEVKLVKVQPAPVWEIWGHDKDDDKPPVEQDANNIPEGAKFKLTTKGKVAAVEVRSRSQGQSSLCDSCKWCSRPGGVYVCDQAYHPSSKRKQCKFYIVKEEKQ